jgi:hypothetical protein
LDGGSTAGDFKKKNASHSLRVSWPVHPVRCPGKVGLLGDTSRGVCLSFEYGFNERQNNCWQCANQKGKILIVAHALSSLKYIAINLGEKM